MKKEKKPRNQIPVQSPLRTKEEAAEYLRCSTRQIEVLTATWKRNQATRGISGGLPSGPSNGLRPTVVSQKLIYWDDRDLREFIYNARLQQQGLDPKRMEDGS